MKPFEAPVLRSALEQVLRGQPVLCPRALGALFEWLSDARFAANPRHLSARELQVLGCLAGGASDKEIAETLGISRITVHRHLANLFAKLKVHNRDAAAHDFVFGLLRD